MAKVGKHKEALLLLSTAKRFNVQRRHILLKYGMFYKLTPIEYFNNLTEFCVLSHMNFPMHYLQKPKFTSELHKFVLGQEKQESVDKVNTMTTLLCATSPDLIDMVNTISTLTSQFACTTDHPEEEHREHIIMRIFAHSISLNDHELAQKVVKVLNPSSGLLLSFYCDALNFSKRLPQKHKTIVNIIRDLDNIDAHHKAFDRLFALTLGNFDRLHKQLNEDNLLSPKGRVIFFLNAMFALFAERREEEAHAIFKKYASSYINPAPPTIVRMNTPMRLIFLLVFMPVMESTFGQTWIDWLRANNFTPRAPV